MTSKAPKPLRPLGLLLLALMAAACGGTPAAPGPAATPTPTPTPTPPACLPFASPFAKHLVAVDIPECSRQMSAYGDATSVLGPPDAGTTGPDLYFGFLSLGFGGSVTVDMESCLTDGPGADLRVYQSVSSEPVTVFASRWPDGPYLLLAEKVPCNVRSPGLYSGHCDFDLAAAGLPLARYFRVRDAELTPCEQAPKNSPGADIDALEILNAAP